MDPVVLRLYRKALANQLAISVGAASSEEQFSIPRLGPDINAAFGVQFSVEHPLDWYRRWNEFVDATERIVPRVTLVESVAARIRNAQPTALHRALALVPVSNFVDTTFDRSLIRALFDARRSPRVHDWNHQMLGGWSQTNPDTPNVFPMLPRPDSSSPWGIHELTSKQKLTIQIANIGEMLDGRDLVLIDFSPDEAGWILNLHSLATAGEKIVNYTQTYAADPYWSARGVLVRNQPIAPLIEQLTPSEMPSIPPDEPGRYSSWDMLTPRTKLIDLMRKKRYDVFISYYSGDAAFVDRLERDLTLRELFVWRDELDVEIGDSLSQKIQEGLTQSYSMIVVLSPDALQRPWVLEELRAAYALRLGGELKILPVLHKNCILPAFLSDYRYADFRDEQRYEESLAILERSIKNAVKRARQKR